MESYRRARRFHRLVRRTAATRPMAKIYGVIQEPLDRLVYRLTSGATTASSWLAGVEITMLTTTSAKTGTRRTPPQPRLVPQPAREPARHDRRQRRSPRRRRP